MPLSWLALIIAGAALGWLTSVILRLDSGREILALVGLGALGAVLGALLITPVLAGRLGSTGFSLPGVMIALLGSFVAIGLTLAVQRLAAARPRA